MSKVRWKVITGLAISFLFLAYALSRVNYTEMIAAFTDANYWWTIPMMISVVITMLIRAARWKWLVEPIQPISFKSLYSSVMIGFMANNLLPARIGEVVRAVSLSRTHSLSKSAVFATVVAERVFDSLGLLFVFMLTLIFIDFPDELRQASLLVAALTFGVLVFLYLLKGQTDLAVRVFCKPVGFFSGKMADRADSILRKFAGGLSILTSPVSIVVIFLYSVFLWVFTAISGYLIFIAFNLYPDIWAAFIVLFVTVLAVSLPASPGYIGTFHAACIIAFNFIGALGMFGQEVSNSVALSFSVILWSCQFFPVTIIGLYYLKKEHLKFKDIGEGDVLTSAD
ncbi:MAG: flippase-like domain-containing protein [candidate division Zixibacteria bacterium]|nr:flippase-like domain-containing protein [candidate division Zixibacteria bacterium]